MPIKAKDFPIVGGHEGAGVVVKVGQNVKDFKVGDRAGVQVGFEKSAIKMILKFLMEIY